MGRGRGEDSVKVIFVDTNLLLFVLAERKFGKNFRRIMDGWGIFIKIIKRAVT